MKQTFPYVFVIFLVSIFLGLGVSICPKNAFSQTPAAKKADHLKQGISNLKQENYEEALEDFKNARKVTNKLIKLDPKNPESLYMISKYYYEIHDYKKALSVLAVSTSAPSFLNSS